MRVCLLIVRLVVQICFGLQKILPIQTFFKRSILDRPKKHSGAASNAFLHFETAHFPYAGVVIVRLRRNRVHSQRMYVSLCKCSCLQLKSAQSRSAVRRMAKSSHIAHPLKVKVFERHGTLLEALLFQFGNTAYRPVTILIKLIHILYGCTYLCSQQIAAGF